MKNVLAFPSPNEETKSTKRQALNAIKLMRSLLREHKPKREPSGAVVVPIRRDLL